MDVWLKKTGGDHSTKGEKKLLLCMLLSCKFFSMKVKSLAAMPILNTFSIQRSKTRGSFHFLKYKHFFVFYGCCNNANMTFN